MGLKNLCKILNSYLLLQPKLNEIGRKQDRHDKL